MTTTNNKKHGSGGLLHLFLWGGGKNVAGYSCEEPIGNNAQYASKHAKIQKQTNHMKGQYTKTNELHAGSGLFRRPQLFLEIQCFFALSDPPTHPNAETQICRFNFILLAMNQELIITGLHYPHPDSRQKCRNAVSMLHRIIHIIG